ncbi:MAG TPA: dTDP-4-dehydrorhamnose 3,5-epimerase [Pseudobdellovibrionaceae bacterium]|jgi:dTDP-4-dehydrorhamnose 3,5-epimerase
MEIQKFDIQGPLLIHLKTFHDNRGFFVERYNENKFKELGLPTNFVQDNFSRSAYGVLRGLHYQNTPPQGKMVSCTFGEIFDVAVDVRKDSPTFGKHVSVRLQGDHPALFWVPAGFAHGFCVTSKQGADVMYKVDNLWSAAGEGSILWSDPDLQIPWPLETPILSEKDAKCPLLKNRGRIF